MRLPKWGKIALGVLVVLSLSRPRTVNAARAFKATSWSFRAKLADVAGRLGVPPLHLAAVIGFESGFNPRARNPASGATGLIQFMPGPNGSAAGLGTSTDQLASMTDIAQLDYVERFLAPRAGKLHSLQDLYMAILSPAAVGQPETYPIFVAPSKAYQQNRLLDADGDGVVTAGDAVLPVARVLRDLQA